MLWLICEQEPERPSSAALREPEATGSEEAKRLLLNSYSKLRDKTGEIDLLTRRALQRIIHL